MHYDHEWTLSERVEHLEAAIIEHRTARNAVLDARLGIIPNAVGLTARFEAAQVALYALVEDE